MEELKKRLKDESLIKFAEDNAKKLNALKNLEALNKIRLDLFGKKGEITARLRGLSKLPKELRPAAGEEINAVSEFLRDVLENKKKLLERERLQEELLKETLDVTLPGKPKKRLGALHPLSIIKSEICELFSSMGFEIKSGPEVETEYYNFEALNIPKNHPVRDAQDTFYTKCGNVLRTHTSGAQIRTMEKQKPPIRIIAPGAVFRSDKWDSTHGPVFHQLEGLVVDEDVTMADLKGVLEVFAKYIIGETVITRFRPSYFPFTEPSAEMDVSCFVCSDDSRANCVVCKGTGWIELLGCGMVHPVVLNYCDLDPMRFSGYAFGMGLERIAMLRWQISDYRMLYENDTRFLSGFGFA